jgi:hypothetical protein
MSSSLGGSVGSGVVRVWDSDSVFRGVRVAGQYFVMTYFGMGIDERFLYCTAACLLLLLLLILLLILFFYCIFSLLLWGRSRFSCSLSWVLLSCFLSFFFILLSALIVVELAFVSITK